MKRRSSSGDPGIWSDPREGYLSLGPSFPDVPSSVEELGIAIPAFLQPLLGLDFVPYLPQGLLDNPEALESFGSSDDRDVTNLEGFDYDENDERPNPLSPEQGVERGAENRPGTQFLETHDEEDSAYVEEFLQSLSSETDPNISVDEQRGSPSTGEPSKESTSTKRNRKHRGNFIRKFRGKLEDRRTIRKERRRTRSWTWNDENKSISKRKGEKLDTSLSWFQEQQQRLEGHQSSLKSVQSEARAVEARTAEIYKRIDLAQTEVSNLQNALVLAEQRLRQDLSDFETAKSRLATLETRALEASQAIIDSIREMRLAPSSDSPRGSEIESNPSDVIEVNLDGSTEQTSPDQPLQIPIEQFVKRERAATAPAAVRVESFMRVHDLDIVVPSGGGFSRASSQSSLSLQTSPTKAASKGFIFVDSNMSPILENLSKLGYDIATDESDRFSPTSDTKRLLSKFANEAYNDNTLLDWPVSNWKLAHESDVLVWIGDVGHGGFGSDWPVVKARTLVETSPRSLIEFMMDSSRIKEYNKMSLGRKDIVRIQEGLDVTCDESLCGFPGDCKIVRSLNKPRFLPITIETLSLYYSKPLETAPGSYMTVIRSVFEDDNNVHKSRSGNTVSEMLLGVLLFRPANEEHTVTEFTTITHVYSPGVPEMLARRMAPSSAYSMMKDVQNVFKQNS